MRGREVKSDKMQKNHNINKEMHLRHLPPSIELIEHYKARLKKLNTDYESLSNYVKDCKAICDNVSRLQQELLQRDNEVSHLQQAISDLQVYVFQERQQVLSLYAENDRLKIKNAEFLRRIEILRSISGVSEEELTLFVKQSGSGTCVVPRRVPQKCQKSQRKTVKNAKGSGDAKLGNDAEESDEMILLKLRAQALEAQLTEQKRLHEDEVTALRHDRELMRAERTAERQRQQERIDDLAAQLEAARSHICELTSQLVEAKQEHLGLEAHWLAERERLIKTLDIPKEQSGYSYLNKGVVLPGGGTKGCGVISVLKEQLANKERLLATYQEQCVAMEAEVTRLHEQMETSKALFKDKIQKMASQVSYLRNKYAELDRRRLCEAEGFRSDIRLMRARLRELERGFGKVGGGRTASWSGSRNSQTSLDTGLTSTAVDTMERARQLESELKNIRNKVINLESELQVENDEG